VAGAITWRDFRITRSYRFAIVFDVLFGIVSLAIYFYISKTLGDPAARDLAGAPSYFAFVAVGVSLTVVVQAASSGLARRLREEQLTGTLEALVAEPVAAPETSLGLAGFPFLFAILRLIFYVAIAVLVFGVSASESDPLGFIIVLAVTGLAMAAIGIALCALVLIYKRGETLMVLATFALVVGGGAYFPTEVLPGALEALANLSPTRFALDGLREAAFQGDGWAGDAIALAAFAIIAFPVAMLAFDGALRYARRQGSVAQY
jgi:ABC-2 type transport system permease protein